MTHIDEDTLNIRKGMGQSAVENLRDWLDRKDMTRQDALAGVTLFFHEHDRAAAFAEQILMEPDELIRHALQIALKKEVVSQWTKKVSSWDAISQISVSTYNEARSWEPYWLYNDQVWIRGLVTPGQFGLICGEALGVGKTGLAVRLMAPTIRAKRHILTNIRLFAHPAAGMIHEVTKLSEIIRLGIQLTREGVYWIAYLDEANFFFSRRDATTKAGKDFEKFLRWIRKFNGSVVFITHFGERDVPEIVRPLLTTRFEKLGKPRMRVEIRSPEFKIFRRINHVPDASKEDGWEYDTNAKAGLAVDVDIARLQAWVNKQSPSSADEEARLILQYLDERPSPDEDDEPAPQGVGTEPEVDPEEAIVDEIRANPTTYRKEGGRVDYDAVRSEFPSLKDAKVYELGRRAKAKGWVGA